MEDLYCVVIDNRNMMISVPTLSAFAQNRIHLITTDERHLPVSETLPLNTNYHCYRVLKKQLEMNNDFKGLVWKRVIETKINNQATCLENIWADLSVIKQLREMASEILPHDRGNREAISAKMYFRNLFGSDFIRFNDDDINAILNYGYTIMRSGVAKSLVSHGFNCVLGIHHISETNEFNLADDFMEPLRPLIDEWIVRNQDCLKEGLSKYVKNELVNLVNSEILFEGKRMKVRYAIDSMCRSLVTAVETNNPDRVILPEVIYYHEK